MGVKTCWPWGNCCYVAVCSAAQCASAPTGEERGGGIPWRPPAYSLFSIAVTVYCSREAISVFFTLLKNTLSCSCHKGCIMSISHRRFPTHLSPRSTLSYHICFLFVYHIAAVRSHAAALELILNWGQERRGPKVRERGGGGVLRRGSQPSPPPARSWERFKLPSGVRGAEHRPPKGFLALCCRQIASPGISLGVANSLHRYRN